MSPRTKAKPAAPPSTRSEDRLRVVKIDDKTGAIELELTRRGRVYLTTIPGDDSVTMIEAAALCAVTRSTVYNWGKPPQRSYGYSRSSAPLVVKDGRVELPELRRFLAALGQWWLTDHPAADRLARRGPVGGDK